MGLYMEWLEMAEKESPDASYLAERCLVFSPALARGYPTVSGNLNTQAWYIARRLDGDSHKLAEMMVLAQPPSARTDREFLEGHCNGNQFEKTPAMGDFYKREAEAAGQDVTGKIYLSGLAAYPGDPRAWVSGRDDVKRVVEERGWDCHGAVNVTSERQEPGPGLPYGVAPDLVDERVMDEVAKNPDLARKELGEVREMAARQMMPHWASSTGE